MRERTLNLEQPRENHAGVVSRGEFMSRKLKIGAEVGQKPWPKLPHLPVPARTLHRLRDEAVEGAHVSRVEQIEREVLVDEQLVPRRGMTIREPLPDLRDQRMGTVPHGRHVAEKALHTLAGACPNDWSFLLVAGAKSPTLELDPLG